MSNFIRYFLYAFYDVTREQFNEMNNFGFFQ